MDWSLLARYALEFALLYPAALLCYLPMRGCLRARARAVALAALGGVTLFIAAASLLCAHFALSSNALLLPAVVLCFFAYRRTVSVSAGKALFAFSLACALSAFCSILTAILFAGREVGNAQPVWTFASCALCLGLSALMPPLYALVLLSDVRWLLQDFDAERIWRGAWLLPALFTGLFVFLNPEYPETILVNRVQTLGVLIVIVFLLMLIFFVKLFQMIAWEVTVNARLAQENQLLSVESSRYAELRAYMDETAHLRHDFRQHLHVIAGLAEQENLADLRQYLRAYEGELGEERVSLCANAAVDAIAAYYAQLARRQDVPVAWQLDLPPDLPLSEVDLCMLLGNLVENALHASVRLPQPQRRVRVICRMLSPAMLGLIVENAFDGKPPREGLPRPAGRGGRGIGLLSVEATVRRYNGKLTIETEGNVFIVSVLLNV
ncbi:MAG: GHKL domain-containing protein [Clostridia bacterium]|nr:GHKL domain-containing protein [Clostridia bacterium]